MPDHVNNLHDYAVTDVIQLFKLDVMFSIQSLFPYYKQ